MPVPTLRTSLLAAVLALSLSACSGGDPAEPDASPSGSPNETAEPSASAGQSGESYQPAPAGVSLTEPGTALDLGDTATVAFPIEGDDVGVLKVRVDALTEVTAREFRGWLSPQALEQSRPYFVEMTLANAGETRLGGHDVPVHLLDDNGTLAPPWAFDGRFKPCQSGPLPRKFGPGDRATTCLVYLAPMRGTVESMAFVPDAEAEPITWTGKVATPKEPAGKGREKDRSKGGTKRR